MAKEEDIQQEYFKLQLLSSQLKELEKQINNIEDQIVQLRNLKDSVNDVESFKEGSKIHSPISPGIYVEGELKNSKEVLMNIGSRVFVKKDIKGAEEIVQKRINKMEEEMQKATSQFQEISLEARNSQEKIQQHV